MHPSSAAIAETLERFGVKGPVLELASSTRTAAEAAAALGCTAGAIANSLVFVADDTPVLVLTSGAHRVDTAFVARTRGWSSMRRATVDEVRAATGQPIGGVAPVGHPSPLATFIDADLAPHREIWASAGTPHAVFATTFEELARITGAEIVSVTAS